MKVSTGIFALSLLLASVCFTPVRGVVDEGAEEVFDPCVDGVVDDEEGSGCLDVDGVCTFDPEACCTGLVCSGFGFFKKCMEPPVCLDEWHDCSEGTPCCDGLACIIGKAGQFECQKPQIGSRTILLPPGGGMLVEPTDPPTTPPKPKNLVTTKLTDGSPVVTNIACSTGDPHIRTFDGLRYDCQGEGEFVLAKSLVTQREIQARYEHMASSRAISLGKGVAVQDEGDTPRVQVSIAKLEETVGNDMGDGCTLLFYVDGEQRDLNDGSGDDRVTVELNNNKINIKYTVSEMEVTVNYRRCRMDICANIPNTDLTVGVLGTANGDSTDEWMTLEGEVVAPPESRANKLKKPGYDYCTGETCIRDPEDSLFVYHEAGIEFDTFQKCDLPYGSTLEQYLTDTPQWVIDICGPEVECIMDVMNGDATDVIALRRSALLMAGQCNPTGGECDDSKCCDGLTCVDQGGLAGKVCDGDMSCAPEMGNCADLGCCEGLTCTELNDGNHLCLDDRVCQDEWMSCTEKDCCDGLVCLSNGKGGKQCRKLPQCMKEWDDCTMVGCCGKLTCVDRPDGGKRCEDRPSCWDRQWRDCTEIPCCDGLTCITKNERNVCAKLPECVKLGKSCEWSPCCEDAENPTVCTDVIDSKGRQAKQCRLVPGDVEVRVFNDVNANGVQDEGEPGIENVGLRLVNNDKTNVVGHEEVLLTDVNGLVNFAEVPKGKPFRIGVTNPPSGAIATKDNRGEDDSIDSDLRGDGFSHTFRLSGTKWTNTAIGYLLPQDVEVKVFNDLNSNGIQDEGEMGIRNVDLRLVTTDKGIITNLSDQNNGGNAHTQLTTNENGLVTFTSVPQNVHLRVKVTGAPPGAIPTKKNAGKDDAVDSDLNNNGLSDYFRVVGGSSHSNVDLGYRMPESVMVRVWDDTNSNGVQDQGENGIEGVELRLVNNDKNKTNVSDQGNGGNANEVLTTDASGLVTFTKVPQNEHLRVKVVTPPTGAIETHKNKGGDEAKDSDLNDNGLSDAFRLETSGAAFSEIDLGYRMPNSIIVRVWDDSNGDGIQDDDESGIPGVKLRLVNDDRDKTNLEDQESGGNCHEELATNDEGFVSFTMVPQSKRFRVKVTNAPPGASITRKNQGKDEEKDSDLNDGGLSDAFTMGVDDLTKIDLGYKMPTSMAVRVWDDENNNGLQDEGEPGISDVKLRLILDSGKANLPDQNNGGNAHEEISTNDDGLAVFQEVPKGVRLQVKVTNKPAGASRALQNRGEDDENDSDLRRDSTSDIFDLGTFEGSIFGSVDLGYLMPDDVEVRVWDDANNNGIQEADELGIEGVALRLVNNDKTKTDVTDVGNGGNAHEELVTDARGLVKFTKVPKDKQYRVKVLNKPTGAVRTQQNKGKDAGADSDLRSDMTSDDFRLASFAGSGPFGEIDLGFKMPDDMQVRVWDDINGDGIQDEDEPGIQGVRLRLVNNDRDKTNVANIGGGSTAHSELTTNEDGIVLFKIVPKGRDFRVKVTNPPGGAVRTKQNQGKNEAGDSDLRDDMTSDVFNHNSFTGAGAYGNIDLGFKMPKTMIIRVWNDVNGDGVQDDDEEGIEGVGLRLVLKKGETDLPDQNNGGNAHEEVFTLADGKATFTGVPQAIEMLVKVTVPPANANKATKKNRGGDDHLDSELVSTVKSDAFRLPSDVSEMYDMLDLGYILN